MGTHAVSFTETPEWQETEVPFLKALESPDLPGEDGEPMENERERIQISLGIGWTGTVQIDDTVRMRFYTPEGELVQISGEAEKKQKELAQQRAEKEKKQKEKEKRQKELAP